MRRLPRQHPPPVATKAVRSPLLTQSTEARLETDGHERRLAPGVFPRPPAAEVRAEERECGVRVERYDQRVSNGFVHGSGDVRVGRVGVDYHSWPRPFILMA